MAGRLPRDWSDEPFWDEEVKDAILRALAPAPEDRFQSATDFSRALQGLTSERRQIRFGRGLRTAIAIFSIVGLGLGIVRFFPTDSSLDPRLVVVSLINDQLGDPRLEGLSGPAAHRVTQGIQQTGVLRVVPYETVEKVYDYLLAELGPGAAGNPMRRLAEETGAGIVITGTFLLFGDSLGLQLDVVDGRSGRLISGVQPLFGSRDEPLEVIDAARSRLMSLLALNFDERLPPSLGTTGRPPTFDAYRTFSEGLRLYVRNDFEESLSRFLQAFQQDSSFVESLLYASVDLTNLGRFDEADSLLAIVAGARDRLSDYDRAWLDYRRFFLSGSSLQALEAIRLAAELAPGSKATFNHALAAFENRRLAEALEAFGSLRPEIGPMRGFIPYWELLAALHHVLGDHKKELEVVTRARDFYPSRVRVLGLEIAVRSALGHLDQVDELIQTLAMLPLDDESFGEVVDVMHIGGLELLAHGYAGKARETLETVSRWLESRERTAPLSPRERLGQVRVLYALGHLHQGAEKARELYDDGIQATEMLGIMGRVNARLGLREDALAVSESLARSEEHYPPGNPTVQRALIMAAMDEPERAVGLLRQAFEDGYPFGSWTHRHPDLQVLKGSQAFQDLVRPVSTSTRDASQPSS
jgi:tetratricopeptide (TPR) repeat protein